MSQREPGNDEIRAYVDEHPVPPLGDPDDPDGAHWIDTYFAWRKAYREGSDES